MKMQTESAHGSTGGAVKPGGGNRAHIMSSLPFPLATPFPILFVDLLEYSSVVMSNIQGCSGEYDFEYDPTLVEAR